MIPLGAPTLERRGCGCDFDRLGPRWLRERRVIEHRAGALADDCAVAALGFGLVERGVCSGQCGGGRVAWLVYGDPSAERDGPVPSFA